MTAIATTEKNSRPFVAHTIERAMSFPMDQIVRRYAKDEELPMDVAQEHERELKRYLALCAINKDASYGMAGPVDDLWHTFIVFTKEYQHFCKTVAGEFLHHIPNVGDESHKDHSSYELFLTHYETTFGEKAPSHIWPTLCTSSDEFTSCAGTGCARCTKCSNCNKGLVVSCKGCDGCGFGK